MITQFFAQCAQKNGNELGASTLKQRHKYGINVRKNIKQVRRFFQLAAAKKKNILMHNTNLIYYVT